MTNLIYGRLQHRNEYVLLDKEAGERMQRACECSTWGEYAQVAGMDWETFVEEWKPAVDRLRGTEEELEPDTPMETDWTSIAGSHHIGDLIRDARMEAVFSLPSGLDFSSDPVLKENLQIGGGSPGPNIDVVTAGDAETFERLEEFLHEQGHTGVSIEHDQDFVDATYAQS